MTEKQNQICANCGKPKEEHLCANCGKPKEEHLCANCGKPKEEHLCRGTADVSRKGNLNKTPDISNNSTLKQVEELEKGFELNNLDCDKEILADLIDRAKLLKAEIEKGCGEDLKRKTFDGNINLYCGIEIFVSEKLGLKNIYCPKCQNLIERLNKIIGEKE